jgi:hypothetical protein
MGGRGSGFASMSKGKLKKLSSDGGKNASKPGTSKHTWDKVESQAAAAKAVRARMARLAAEAFRRLVSWGYEPTDITALGLTDKEIVYYGGVKAERFKTKRMAELDGRLGKG